MAAAIAHPRARGSLGEATERWDLPVFTVDPATYDRQAYADDGDWMRYWMDQGEQELVAAGRSLGCELEDGNGFPETRARVDAAARDLWFTYLVHGAWWNVVRPIMVPGASP